MANTETQRLVSMTNDIAANLVSYVDGAERTADHIKRFWTPRMISMLLEYVGAGGSGLSDEGQQAMGWLQDAPAKPFGVILAGGRSSRMGVQRKPLVVLNEEPMLAHVIRRLQPQVQQVFLSCEPGDEALAGFDCPLIGDAVSGHRGPLTGLYSTLLYLKEHQLVGGLLLCPCDAPFIPASLVEQLQASALKAPGSVAVVSYEGVLQPTFSLWQTQHLAAIEAAVLGKGQGGLKHMLYALPHTVVEWPIAQPPPFYNINTPEQLAVASEWLAGV